MLTKVGEKAGIENPAPGLKNINPHCLRHSYARHLKDAGMSIEAIQNIMGHSSFKTIRMTNNPVCHISPVIPATNDHSWGINNAFIY